MSQLFSLIKSLDKSEKRYFQLNASLQDGEKQYLKLFELIEESEYPNDPVWRNFFLNENNYYHHKKYLYKQLIDCLRNYHSKDINSRCNSFLGELEILRKKALFDVFEKRIKVAQKFGEKYEQFGFLLRLTDYQFFYASYLKKNKTSEENFRVYEQLSMYQEITQGLTDIKMLEIQLSSMIRRRRRIRTKEEQKELDVVAQNPLLKPKRKFLSHTEKMIFINCHILISKLQGNIAKVKVFGEKMIAHFEANPFLFEINLIHYLNTIFSLLGYCTEKRATKEMPGLFKKVEKFYGKSVMFDIHIFQALTSFQLSYYDRMEKRDELLSFIEKVDVKLEALKDFMQEQGILVHYSNLVLYTYSYSQYDKTLKYIDKGLNYCTKNNRLDLFNLLAMIKPFVLFELGKFDELEDATEVTYRRLYSKKSNFKPELAVLHFFKTTPFMVASKKEIKMHFVNFKAKILEITKNSPYVKGGFLYHFQLDDWLDNKIMEFDCKKARAY